MTEQQDQGDPPGIHRRRARSLRATFRVDEIRARSTPQLVAIVGGITALATGFSWRTISLVSGGAPFGWHLAGALFVDLAVVVCLPGVLIAVGEILGRLRRLLTADADGPLVARSARAATRLIAQARTDTDGWFDGMSIRLLLAMLITPLLFAGFGAVVAIDGIQNGWTPDMRVLVAVGIVALLLVPLSVPAALGSLVRRYRRRRGRPE